MCVGLALNLKFSFHVWYAQISLDIFTFWAKPLTYECQLGTAIDFEWKVVS